MSAIEVLRATIPEHSQDIQHNLAKVFADATLSSTQLWGTALACALTTRHDALVSAVLTDARTAGVRHDALDDACSAASLMAMTNVFYRFKHFMADEELEKMPARLRMKRSARPAGDPRDFELFCVAVSAMNGCASCVRHHSAAALDRGLTRTQLADGVRIGATLAAVAVALG